MWQASVAGLASVSLLSRWISRGDAVSIGELKRGGAPAREAANEGRPLQCTSEPSASGRVGAGNRDGRADGAGSQIDEGEESPCAGVPP